MTSSVKICGNRLSNPDVFFKIRTRLDVLRKDQAESKITRDKMKIQSDALNGPRQLSLDETEAYIKEAKIQAEADKSANSRFIRLSSGTSKVLLLTGTIFAEEKVFEGNTKPRHMLAFETTELNALGEHKIFSLSASNPAAEKLRAAIKSGTLKVAIERKGDGTSTVYTVIPIPA